MFNAAFTTTFFGNSLVEITAPGSLIGYSLSKNQSDSRKSEYNFCLSKV